MGARMLHNDRSFNATENIMSNIELNWELTWVELAEMAWWEANPTATEAEFEAEFYGK